MRPLKAILAVIAVGLAIGGCTDVDWNRTIGGLASSACRGADSCTAVCPDGSTLDGRPASARCRR
ncbi:hypothetical protein [Thalassobaculum sp.]|uniref:hypothetical protein n=1 Tax=Thalassobaculum sp. TaxID=2022740 RepID=UPI0032EC2F95